MFKFKLKNSEILEYNNGIPLVSDEGFKREIQELIKQGYIHKDGSPIKCTECDCTKLKKYNVYYTDDGSQTEEEYSIRCSKCKTELGYWAYGNWGMI